MTNEEYADVYRRAAKLVHDGLDAGMCNAVDVVGEEDLGLDPEVIQKLVDAVFRIAPSDDPMPLPAYWGDLWDESIRKECRVLGLCFLAAMAETGDLGLEAKAEVGEQ